MPWCHRQTGLAFLRRGCFGRAASLRASLLEEHSAHATGVRLQLTRGALLSEMVL